MRVKVIALGVVSAMVFASFGGMALAVDSAPTKALSTRLGSASCASFTHMSKSRQERLVHRMTVAAPKGSLVVTASDSSDQSNGQTPAAGPLQASDIVAACQAATPKVAIRDAYAKFSTGAGISANH